MTTRPFYYRFNDYQLDPVGRKLLLDGEVIEVQSQVFDLLHYLVQNPGQMVSKELLLNEVWKNQYLTDATVTQAVKKARLAIGDDGQKQKIIKTVYAKGVRFELPVETVHMEASDQPKSRVALYSIVSVCVIALIPLIWFLLSFNFTEKNGLVNTDSEQPTLMVFPFTNMTGNADYDWLEYGLAQTTGLLLDQSSNLALTMPDVSAELHTGELSSLTALYGSNVGLRASINLRAEQFIVQWELARADQTQSIGEFVTADVSLIARQLVDAVTAELFGKPIAPVIQLPLLNDPLAMELYSRGIQAMYVDDLQQARAMFSAAQARLPDDDQLKLVMAIASFDQTDIPNSLTRYQELLDELPHPAREERARLAYEIGTQLWFAGEMSEAARLLTQSFDLSEPNELLRARILNSLSFVYQSQQQYDQAWELAKQAEVQLREQGDPYHLSMVLTNLGYLAEDLGRITEAGSYHQEALEIRQHYGFPSLVAASQYGLARIARRSGEFAKADGLLNKALVTVTELDKPYDQFDNLEELVEVRLFQQRFEEASELLKQARQLAVDNEDDLGVAWSDQVLVRLWLRLKKADDEALQLNHTVYLALQDSGETQGALAAQLERAELLILSGREEDATQLINGLNVTAFDENRVLELKRTRLEAELAVRRNDIEQATELYRSALRGAREIGVLDLEAEIALDTGYLALMNHDIGWAKRMLAIARAWSGEYYRTHQLDSEIKEAEQLIKG